MLLYISLSGILLSAILLWFNARQRHSAILLGLYFLLISLYGLSQYTILYTGSVVAFAVIFIHTGFLHLLTGPLLYLYVRNLLADHPRLYWKDLFHLLPSVGFIILALPYITSPWIAKLWLGAWLLEDIDRLGSLRGMIMIRQIPVYVLYVVRSALFVGYVCATLILYVRFVIQKRERSVFASQHFVTRWVSVLLAFSLVLAISYMFLQIQSSLIRNVSLFYTMNLFQLLSAAGLTGLILVPFFFPGILYGMPRLPVEPGMDEPPQGIEDPQHTESKTAYQLESDYLRSIGEKVETCMEELHPYLQPGFSLAHLSTLIGVPAHHLAIFFREYEESFVEYRNRWRVRYAKKLIDEGKASGVTLEAIGTLSGFSSRNTFLNAFRKAEGISPHDYLNRLK